MPAPKKYNKGDIISTNEIIEKDIKLTNEKHRTYWKCKCLNCGTIRSVRVDNLHQQCSYCANKNKKHKIYKDLTNKKFGLWTVIKKAKQPNYWTCKCECGTIKDVFRGNLTQGNSKSCGCVSSWGEKQIIYWLNYYNINYKKEVCFTDLKTNKNGNPRFDFVLYKDNQIFCIIEYDGRQHKYYKQNWKMKIDDFKRLQYIDELKNTYCINHNIPLYRFNNENILQDEIYNIYKIYSQKGNSKNGTR